MLYIKFHHINLWFNHSLLCLALDSWLLVRVVLVFRHVCKIMTVSFIMFVCPPVLYPLSWNSLPPTGWIFLKFAILVFFLKFCWLNSSFITSWQELQVLYRKTSIHAGSSHSILLRTRNVSNEILEKIKTEILFSIIFFKNRSIDEIMWKNILEPDRPQMTI